MLKLYLTRHGQTVWNTQRRMQGQNNSPLTETGIEQARRLALRMHEIPLDGIIHSPLPRAVDTARILTEGRSIPLISDDRLMEQNFGAWEGCVIPEMYEKYPVKFAEFWVNPNLHMELRGGESFDHLLERTGSFLDYAASLRGRWLVVTHGFTLRSIRMHIKRLAIENSRVRLPSCTYCQLDLTDNGFDMRTFDDGYHLRPDFRFWWHGSDFPDTLTVLRAGSTITRIQPLAEAFSHRPSTLSIADDGSITHNGAAPGRLYIIDEPVCDGDAIPHPRTSMPDTYEYLTTRELKLRPAQPRDCSGDAVI